MPPTVTVRLRRKLLANAFGPPSQVHSGKSPLSAHTTRRLSESFDKSYYSCSQVYFYCQYYSPQNLLCQYFFREISFFYYCIMIYYLCCHCPFRQRRGGADFEYYRFVFCFRHSRCSMSLYLQMAGR